MPIYEYQCAECSAHLELIQKISEPPKTTCPDCGGKLHKLISLNSFQLKGGGWYADGYGSKQASGSNLHNKPACARNVQGPCNANQESVSANATAEEG